MKIVLYTNILTPYRKYLFDLFHECCKRNDDDFVVLVMAKTENDRCWMYEQYATPYTQLLKGMSYEKSTLHIHYNFRLKEIIKGLRPDVVIASGSYCCPGTWQIAKWKSELNYHVLFWSESHLNEKRSYSSLKIKFREVIRNAFYKKFDAFICPGVLASNFVRKYAGTNAKCYLLPNLVDRDVFSGNENQYENNKVVFLCPARLSPVKGLEEFMDLWSRCSHKNEMQLWLAGDGELRNKLQQKSDMLGLDTIFFGNQSQADMCKLYQKSNVVVLPSLSDPNPLTSIEALWESRPLLVSQNVGNYPEVIHEGENGYVFSYENMTQSIQIVDKLIDSNREWRTIAGKKSHAIAEKIYDPLSAVNRVYLELVKYSKE